jgi:hypothetical protein
MEVYHNRMCFCPLIIYYCPTNGTLQANYTSTEVQKSALFVSPELYDIAYSTLDDWNNSEITRTEYGYAMFGFWAIVLSIGFMSRAYGLVGPLLRIRLARYTNSCQHRFLPKAQLWVKYWLTTPALGAHRTAEPIRWCTVPPRLESLTIGTFVVINIVSCCVSYQLRWKSLVSFL